MDCLIAPSRLLAVNVEKLLGRPMVSTPATPNPRERFGLTLLYLALEQQRKLMSAVLAGYQSNRESMNPTWQELCKSLSEDMVGRPYLKAIFAYIASNDWSVILNMKELPLCERMAVALRILEDDEVMSRLYGR